MRIDRSPNRIEPQAPLDWGIGLCGRDNGAKPWLYPTALYVGLLTRVTHARCDARDRHHKRLLDVLRIVLGRARTLEQLGL